MGESTKGNDSRKRVPSWKSNQCSFLLWFLLEHNNLLGSEAIVTSLHKLQKDLKLTHRAIWLALPLDVLHFTPPALGQHQVSLPGGTHRSTESGLTRWRQVPNSMLSAEGPALSKNKFHVTIPFLSLNIKK